MNASISRATITVEGKKLTVFWENDAFEYVYTEYIGSGVSGVVHTRRKGTGSRRSVANIRTLTPDEQEFLSPFSQVLVACEYLSLREKPTQ